MTEFGLAKIAFLKKYITKDSYILNTKVKIPKAPTARKTTENLLMAFSLEPWNVHLQKIARGVQTNNSQYKWGERQQCHNSVYRKRKKHYKIKRKWNENTPKLTLNLLVSFILVNLTCFAEILTTREKPPPFVLACAQPRSSVNRIIKNRSPFHTRVVVEVYDHADAYSPQRKQNAQHLQKVYQTFRIF